MPISQIGQINTTALQVADVYVQIVPPQFLLNGVPSNILGLVGTATWGPVNQAVIVGDSNQFSQRFGYYKARKYDMGTHAFIAFQQGASAMKCVRVTDGTDVAASVAVQTNCITFTSKYTGSAGNGIKVTISPGSKASTKQIKVGMPGLVPELFDNIGAGLSGNALWVAIAAAINSGLSNARGPSEIIVATAGAGVTAPTDTTHSLSGGTDGDAVDTSDILGVDTFPRTGMYALRQQDVSILDMCDLDDTTTWATVEAFCSAEGCYGIMTGALSQSISGAKSAKSSAGIDTYALKVLLGDWVYWHDAINSLPTRLVSPQPFVAGLLANLSPQHSSLNKRVYGVIATQKSLTGVPYTYADLQELAGAGIDVITNPVPGGSYFGCRNGRNASSNPVVHGDNYTRMTNYIAQTINRGIGIYIGQLQSADTRRRAKTTLDAFFANLQQQGMIGTPDGLGDGWQVVLDNSNNPFQRVALGYMQADVKVTYLSVIEFLLVNIEGGQSVEITRRSTQLAA